MKRILHNTALLLMALMVTNCSIIEDCKWGTSAELNSKDLPTAFVDTYYEQGIRAGVNNEPRDQDYFYDFEVLGLPPGMDYETDGRDVYIYGTPTRSGRYLLQVDVVVTPIFIDGDGDGIDDIVQMFERRAIRDYALRVN